MHCKLDQNKYVKLARMISETTWWRLLINIKRTHAGDYLTFYYFCRLTFKYQSMDVKEGNLARYSWVFTSDCLPSRVASPSTNSSSNNPPTPLNTKNTKNHFSQIDPVVKSRQNTLSQLHKLLLKHDTGKSSKCSKWALSLAPQPTCSFSKSDGDPVQIKPTFTFFHYLASLCNKSPIS